MTAWPIVALAAALVSCHAADKQTPRWQSCEAKCGDVGGAHAACRATCEDEREMTARGHLFDVVGHCEDATGADAPRETGRLGLRLDEATCDELFRSCRSRCAGGADKCEVCVRAEMDASRRRASE